MLLIVEAGDSQEQGKRMKSDSELHLDVKTLAFAEAAQGVGSERYGLISPAQGSCDFEDLEVLARAMEMDVELRTLVMARSRHFGNHFMN